MRGFRDATRVVDEPNEARMHFRTKPRIKIAIQQAAAHCGTDLSVFTMSAAYHAAMAIRGGWGNLNSRDKWIFRVTAA